MTVICLTFCLLCLNLFRLTLKFGTMKKVALLLAVAFILIPQVIAQSGEDIVHIPDTAFLYALIDVGVDTNEDSLISYNEAESVSYLDVMGREITDMTGIEAFVMLDSLLCDNNNIETLNLSTLSELVFLTCGSNPMDSLDLTNNLKLTDLYVYYGILSYVNLANNPALRILWVRHCNLATLDVSANVNLEDLQCNNNPLNSLDVSNNVALLKLNVRANSLDSIDVSTNVNLELLDCSYCELESLDVSNNLKLKKLYCSDNFEMDTLDISKNYSLEYLYCGPGILSCLYLPTGSALKGLYCFGNSLESIDVTGCTYLEDFRPFDNNLTSLDVSNNPLLKILDCFQNQLTSLDLSNNLELNAIWCGDNFLPTLDLSNNSKIGSIPFEFDHLNLDNMPSLTEVCVWDGFPGDAEISIDGSPNICWDSIACDGVCTSPIGIDGFDHSGCIIYPNPATDFLTIETSSFGPHSIWLHTLSGQEVFNANFTGNSHQLDLSFFRKGVYILHIRSDNHIAIRKVVRL
jgi:hypothetical protein